MSIKSFLITLLAISNVFVYGQNKIQGYVLDKQTAEPLSYATIGALHQQYGTYSDTAGMFTLYYISENDSLKVSNLGYNSLYTCVRNLQKNSKIFLDPNPVKLNEVVINLKKIKIKEMQLGFFTKRPDTNTVPSYSINITATFIPFPANGSNVIIQSVKFPYHMASINFPLRVRILKVKANGEPGDDLISENIIFNQYKKGPELGWSIGSIDMTIYNIYMPQEGIFVALEYIEMDSTPLTLKTGAGKYGPYIGSIKVVNSDISRWVTVLNQSKWMKSPSPTIYAIGLNVVNYTK